MKRTAKPVIALLLTIIMSVSLLLSAAFVYAEEDPAGASQPDLSEEAPIAEEETESLPETVPEVPEETREETDTEISEEISEEITEEIAETEAGEPSCESPEEVPEEAPEEIPEESFEEVPIEPSSEEIPAEIPEETSEKTSEEPSSEILEVPSEEITPEPSEETLQEPSEAAGEESSQTAGGSGSGILEAPDNPEGLLGSYLDLAVSSGEDADLFGNYNGNQLTGVTLLIYNRLRTLSVKLAQGTQISASLKISLSEAALSGYSWPVSVSENDAMRSLVDKAVYALYFDCPYEMYWFSRNFTYTWGGTKRISGGYYKYTSINLELHLEVAPDYRGSSAYTTDRNKVLSVQNAVSSVKQIVTDAAGKNDYEKLRYYKDVICSMNVYNSDAVEDDYTGENDPWQIIYLFDRNPSTNVLCAGYAKGFQYLCDRTVFSGKVEVYSVDGDVNRGDGVFGHKWNIVSFNGTNYLVDVTFLDTGVSESTSFMSHPTGGSVESGYTFRVNSTLQYVYKYRDYTLNTYSRESLTLPIDNSKVADGFHYEDGNWYYYRNNTVQTDRTGIVYAAINGTKAWYYIRNGIYKKSTGFTTKAYDSGSGKYFVKSGKLYKKTGFIKKGTKYYFLKSGRLYNRTGIIRGTISGKTRWFYIKNGRYARSTCITVRADGKTARRYYVKKGILKRITGTVTLEGVTYRLKKGVVQ